MGKQLRLFGVSQKNLRRQLFELYFLAVPFWEWVSDGICAGGFERKCLVHAHSQS